MADQNLYQANMLSDIRRWAQMYKNRAKTDKEDAKDHKILSEFLQDFETFSEDYLAYFDQVIDDKTFDSTETTPIHLQYQALQTVLDEWIEISRVMEQRQLRRYKTWLAQADNEAKKYLPSGIANVITYLGKANTIRHNLYSATSIVSIPRDQYDSNDWMALPHEIGHLVYWNLTGFDDLNDSHKSLDDNVREIVAKVVDVYSLLPEQGQYLTEMIASWVEETFADVFGTLVVGDDRFPNSIVKILRQKTGRADDLFIDDHDHPIPYLRPLLRIKVLELMGQSGAAERAQTKWQDFVDNLPNSRNDDDPKFPISSEKQIQLPLKAIQTALYSVVEQYLFDFANKAQQTGVYSPSDPAKTFRLFLAHSEKLANEQKVQPYKVLLRPLSRAFGETSPHLHNLYYIYKSNYYLHPDNDCRHTHMVEHNYDGRM